MCAVSTGSHASENDRLRHGSRARSQPVPGRTPCISLKFSPRQSLGAMLRSVIRRVTFRASTIRVTPSWGWALLGLFSVMVSGCAGAPVPDAPGLALVAGEWRGDAKVGPKYGCCSGQGGPVRLSLEQNGSVVR